MYLQNAMFLGVLIGLGLLFIFWSYVHCFGSYRCCICRHDGGEGQWLIEEGTSFGDHYCNCYGCICLFYVRLTRNNAVYLKDSRNVNYQSLAPQVIRSINDICGVCLENLEPNHKIIILSCNHGYHRRCIKKWIENKHVSPCPLCHRSIVSETVTFGVIPKNLTAFHSRESECWFGI